MRKDLTDVALTPAGLVTAVFSTFGVLDRDGDVVMPGAIKAGPVAIGTWNHGTTQQHAPIGVGRIEVTSTEAILHGQFFMNTEAGHDTFIAVKALHDAGIGSWSYSLHDIVAKAGRSSGGQNGRLITSVTVREVCPVLAAASINTRTLDAKDRAVIDQALRNAAAATARDQADRDFVRSLAAQYAQP